MGRGYSAGEVRRRLVGALGGGEAMSGAELSRRTGIGRVTMTKYLGVLAADGMLRRRDAGNVTLWSLAPGQEAYDFPADYFRVASLYAELLTGGPEDGVLSLVRNCLRSGASAGRLVLEAVVPAIGSVDGMFADGRIGAAERGLLRATISRSLQELGRAGPEPDRDRNAVLIAADSASGLAAEAAAAAYRAGGWRVSDLGDMSSAIDVLFDLDFEKLVGRVWRQRPGVMVVAVFSGTAEGMRFFADATRPARSKAGRRMRLVLCGPEPPDDLAGADMASGDLGEVLQWSQSAYENMG